MSQKSNIRIIDIAKMAKVSVGTVDRVLHNRGRVSEEKRKKVEEVLEKINYKPNVVARFLASNRSFSFAVIIPTFHSGEYWELVSTGVEKAVEELSNFNVSVDYFYFDQFEALSLDKIIEKLESKSYAGVVLATIQRNSTIELSNYLDENNTPYIFIDSNISDCNNLAYYGSNSIISGAIGAKLMLTNITSDDYILIGQAKYKNVSLSTQMENREKGFRAYLQQQNFKGEIISFTFNPNNKDEYAKQLNSTLHNIQGNVGAIVFNSRIYELVELLDRVQNKDKISYLIGYDPIQKNVQALKDDKISYLISQRSVQQGYECIKALSTKLIFNGILNKDNYMPIDILIKENIDFYHD